MFSGPCKNDVGYCRAIPSNDFVDIVSPVCSVTIRRRKRVSAENNRFCGCDAYNITRNART